MLLIRFCCLLGLARLSWAARLSKEERSQPDVVDGPVDGPAIHWHDSKACREVKEFAPEPAVLKINLDLSKVWSKLPGEALVAIEGLDELQAVVKLGLRKPVGAAEIDVRVLPDTVLNGELQGVKMSLPGMPITSFNHVSFNATSKDSALPMLALSASVVKENGVTSLRFSEESDLNLAFQKLKVRGNGFWSGTVARITNLLSRAGATNVKAFQQLAAALIFRFVVNFANEAMPSELLAMIGSEEHGFVAELVVHAHFQAKGEPRDPAIALWVATRDLALETTRRGLTDFVNGVFDGLRDLGLSDDFEKSRQSLLKMAVEEDLNMDVNVTGFLPSPDLPEKPRGWGPVFLLDVNMDMNDQGEEETEEAASQEFEAEQLSPLNLPFSAFGMGCLSGKSWIDASRKCRSTVMQLRARSNAEDMNDLLLQQSIQLFGTWVRKALKKAFPSLFHKPLEADVLATDARWSQNCSYAMLAIPSGEWWTPILAAHQLLQIHNPRVSELHEIWRNFGLRFRIRQTIYTHPQAGPMVAISDRGLEALPALKMSFIGKWKDLLKLLPPGILYL